MAATFSQMKFALDEISQKNSDNRKRLVNARALLLAAQSNLTAMQTEYAQIVTEINDAAIANPADDAYQLAKAEKDLLVADFQALKTYADSLISAFDTVTE